MNLKTLNLQLTEFFEQQYLFIAKAEYKFIPKSVWYLL